MAEALAAGVEPLAAFSKHDYEPDEPIFTPRVWISTGIAEDGPCLFGCAIRAGRPSAGTDRVTWTPGALAAGEGLLMSTYDGSVDSVSTARAPVEFTTKATSPSELLHEIWNALDRELRVAAMAFDPAAFSSEVHILGRD